MVADSVISSCCCGGCRFGRSGNNGHCGGSLRSSAGSCAVVGSVEVVATVVVVRQKRDWWLRL